MKNLFLLLFLSIPSFLFSQELRINEIDAFTGEKKVYTSYETFSAASMSHNFEVRFCFFTENNNLLTLRLMVTYPQNVLAIEKDAKIMIKTNKNIHTLYADASGVSTIGGAKTRFAGSEALGIKIDTSGDLSFFENEIVQALRIYFFDGYIDANPIKEKQAKKIMNSYKLIQKELMK